MGQSSRRLCHTQDITYDATVREWQPVKRTTRIDEVPGNASIPPACDHAQTKCRALCGGNDGINGVDEVLVVHHEALKKVNFLLRVDELSGCDLPTVPECVVAAKQAEMQKRHLSMLQSESCSRRARSRSKSPGQLCFDAKSASGEKPLAVLDLVRQRQPSLVPKLRNLPQHRATSPRASPRKEGDEPSSMLHNEEDDYFPNEAKISALIAASALMRRGPRCGARDSFSRDRDAPSPERDAPSREWCDASRDLQDDRVAFSNGFEKGDDEAEAPSDASETSGERLRSENGHEIPEDSQHDDDVFPDLPDDSEKVVSVPAGSEDEAEGPSSSLKRTQLKL